MNREIKFRGIREEYNPVWHKSIFKFGNLLERDLIGEIGYCAKVKPESVGQFTGLKDKNGVEIYELHEINHKYRVVYLFNKYVLQSISNSDIFVEILRDEEYEITGEYCPLEKN